MRKVWVFAALLAAVGLFIGCGAGSNPLKDSVGPELPSGEVWSAYVSPTVVILKRGERARIKVLLVRRSGKPHRFAIWIEDKEGKRPWWSSPVYLYVRDSARKYLRIAGSYDAVESGDYVVRAEAVDTSEQISFSLPFKIRKWEPHLVTPPVANLTYSPADVYVGTEVVFDASASYDPDGYIRNFIWRVDGTVVQSGGNILRWKFTSSGPHTVSVEVVDNDGARGSAAVLVDVQEP